MKVCKNCGKEFEAEKAYYYVCKECYYAAIGTPVPKPCKATKKDGSACRSFAKHGFEYCGAHLEQQAIEIPASQIKNWLEILVKG